MGWLRLDVVGIDCDQLGVRAVTVFADDVLPVLEAGVQHDILADLDTGDTVAERLDDPCSVGAENPGLRRRGHPHPRPDVEVVQRRCPQADEHLTRRGDRIGRLLVAEHLRPAVLVDDELPSPGAILAGGTVRPVRTAELQRAA